MSKFKHLIMRQIWVNINKLKMPLIQRKFLHFYSQFIVEGDLCFDIGAHKGNRSEIFSKLGAKVVAVEPQEYYAEYLREKFKTDKNVIVVNKGVSDKEGELPLFICEMDTTLSTFSTKWKVGRFSGHKWNKCKIVKVTTIDDLIKKYGLPKFCKIDVEGFEQQVIKGITSHIPFLSFEFTKENINDTKFCMEHLQSLGYISFNFSLGEEMNMMFKDWISAEDLLRNFSLIKDNFLWGDIYARYE